MEPDVGDIHIFQFRPQKIGYHRLEPLPGDSYDDASFILEKVRANDPAGPKSTPNSDFFWMHLQRSCRLLSVQMRQLDRDREYKNS